MKKSDFKRMMEGLSSLGNYQSTKFNYNVERTLQVNMPEYKAIAKVQENIIEITKEYEQKRVALCIKHASKDETGKPIVTGNEYQMSNMEEFSKEFEALKLEFNPAMEKGKVAVEEFNTLLEEEFEPKLYKLTLEEIPKDINKTDMSLVYLLINHAD